MSHTIRRFQPADRDKVAAFAATLPEHDLLFLGRDLLEAVFAIARGHGLAKLSARMTPDQTSSVALFESLGFRAEALLKDQVRGRDGQAHDLAILSLDPARVAARRHAFGQEET